LEGRQGRRKDEGGKKKPLPLSPIDRSYNTCKFSKRMLSLKGQRWKTMVVEGRGGEGGREWCGLEGYL